MAEVVVVGAGVGGLACAARLASTGHRVTVCEQADTIGGKLGLFERDGFRFDTGPHLLTMPHVLRELFADTGAPLDDVLHLRRLDLIARYRFGDGTWFDAPADDDGLLRNAEAMRPGNAAELQAFLQRAGAIWDATRVPFLESPLDGPRSLLRLATRVRDLRTIAPHRSVRALTERYVSDPRLRTFIDRYATYTGSDPRKVPAALASIPYVERLFGAWYVDGGLRAIGNALADRCRSLGVTIRERSDVLRVTVDDHGRANGVALRDGEVLQADVVVANADAQHVYRDLVAPSRARTAALRRLRRAVPSLSGFVLCLGVRGQTPGLAHHTVLFPEDYDSEFDDLFGALPRIVRTPTIYVSVPRDPSLAPPGHEAWFVLVNAPRHATDDPRNGVDWTAPGVADACADAVLAAMADRGLEVRDRIVLREVRTPADLAARTRAVGGSIYGTSSNGARAAFLRPANRTGIPGLFLVGGSSHPGGGLPLVLLSARITAELVGPASPGTGRHASRAEA